MPQVAEKQEQNAETVKVRFDWPKDVHEKLQAYQRKLAVKLNRRVTLEEASIDFIRTK